MVFTQLSRRSFFLLPLKPSPTASAPKYICRYAGGQPAGGLAESAPEVCASPLVCHVWKGDRHVVPWFGYISSVLKVIRYLVYLLPLLPHLFFRTESLVALCRIW